MRRIGLLALPLAGALALGGAPAIADPVPGPGVPLARTGTVIGRVDRGAVAVDTAGTRIVASSTGKIQERRAGGSWSAPRAIPRSRSPHATWVAAGRAGTALAVYESYAGSGPRTLVAQVRGTNRVWSAPHALTRAIRQASYAVRVLGNDDGDYAVVWARSGPFRTSLQITTHLRGDRWRTTSLGPVINARFDAAMDASGAVYVARDYGAGTTPTSTVRRIKRPGRAASAAVTLPVSPGSTWSYLVERTGRQTLVVNTPAEARVLRQEAIGTGLVTVWRRAGVIARAAVGGGRLRLVWQDPGSAAGWTQMIRPRATAVVALGIVLSPQVEMDRFGRGMIAWYTRVHREPETARARSFTDAVVRAPFVVAREPAAYPEEGVRARWVGWNATDGHQLLVLFGPDEYPNTDGDIYPHRWDLWSTQVKR